jgi:hypothetical protein
MIFQWDLEQYLSWLEWPMTLFLIGIAYLGLAWCLWALVFIGARVTICIYFALTGRVL